MNHTINKYTTMGATAIALGTTALFPLFMLPTTSNYFETNKLALLVVATALLMILWAVNMVVSRTFKLSLIPFSVPLLAFGFFNFLSCFISTPKSPVPALMNRGSLFLLLGLFVTLVGSLVDNRKFIRQAIYTLIGSGTVLAIISIFQSFGFGLSTLLNRIPGTGLPNTLAFSPAGSPLALLTFIGPVILLTLFLAFTKTEAAEKISLFVLSAIMAAAFVVTSVYSFPGKDTAPVFLPMNIGYAIAIETLKTPQTALIGVGTNSFMTAYSQLRPAAMNSSDFWNVRFGASSTEVFQILTTVGLIGLGLFIWLIINMVKIAKIEVRSTQVRAIKITAFGVMLLLFLIPSTYLMYFTLALCLLLWGLQFKFAGDTGKVKTYELAIDPEAKTPQTLNMIGVYTPAALVLIGSVAALFFAGKAYAGEVYFKQAINAAANNDGVGTYNLERQAILQNPFVESYRLSYAATNLALANALAGNKTLSDQDKQNIAQLVQQSIQEAKVAVSLTPEDSLAWENLATVYRSLINAAQGADQWTVASLSQAIQTDPMNPSLRVELGGVYYSLGSYDQAIRLFQQAAELKPDYANAYYNLAHTYEMKKDVVNAYDYMQQTLSLTKPDSADYTKAQGELTDLSKQLPKTAQPQTSQTAPAQSSLQTPSPAPSPATSVTLPAGSGPENATTTPSNP